MEHGMSRAEALALRPELPVPPWVAASRAAAEAGAQAAGPR
jgi:hypothetical protein